MRNRRATWSGATAALCVLMLTSDPATAAVESSRIGLELPPASAYGQRVPRRLLCDPAAWPRPVDGALCDAARLLAREAARAGREVDQKELLARWAPFLAQRQGVPDPRVHAFVIQNARWGVVLHELEEAARRVGPGKRIGVGLAPGEDGAVGVLLSIESVVLPSPFSRRPARGSAPTIQGQLRPGVKVKQALLQGPDGKMRELKFVPMRSPERFRIKLPHLEATGGHRFQLIIERGRGPEIGLLAPLWVETSEPDHPPRPSGTGKVSPDLALDDHAHLLLANLRAEAKLAPLQREPALDRAAGVRARTMAAERKVVHEPKDGRNASTLLREQGFTFRFLAEDVALGPSLPLAFESLLQSPAHRSALLEARADRVGMGAVDTKDGIYLAVLLAGVKPPRLATPLSREIDRQRALLGLYQEIQKERKRAHLRRSRRDPDLDRIAQALVGQLAAAGKTRDPGASAKAKALLADREPRPTGAFVDVVVAPELKDAATSPAALDPGCHELGLGAAVGQRDGLEQAWIVLLCLSVD